MGTSATAQPAGPPRPPGPATHGLDLGELYFGFTYPPSWFTIENDCPYEVLVTVEIFDLPLTAPAQVTAQPGKTTVNYQVTTPPPPPIPVFTPVGPLPHGIYSPIQGTIVIRNPPVLACPPCLAGVKIIDVTGHIHWPTPVPPPDPSGSLDCGLFWRQGRAPPPNLEEACTEPMRAFAALFVAHELDGWRRAEPDAWDWLPSYEEIGRMSIEELLAMKKRARDLQAAASPQAATAAGGPGG